MTEEPELVYWCQACRETGMIHCSAPDECNGMKKIPVEEADAAYKKLTESKS